ncbi:beta-sandwich domain-containing protein [Bdellovibrio bacteriovorus]|uniref:beta-sandwich domain-containing protein n=1 Tax=Bdellovibrio bacteriovorus TaxID=959 RepID=UPI0035A68F11
MKLPMLSALLTAAVLLQGPVAGAQIRPGHPPERGNDERRDNNDRRDNDRNDRRDDRRGPDQYHDRDRDDRRYENDRRDDHRHGGIRPDRPPVRPGPRPDPYPQPYPPHRPDPYPPYPNPPHPPNNYGESTVRFYGVSRRSGGEWLRVAFNYASYVDYVRVNPSFNGIQLHETYAITQSGRRIQLRQLSYTGTFYYSLTSEYLTAGERIVAIDIRAESMGGNADINVTVTSSYGAPSIYPIRY